MQIGIKVSMGTGGGSAGGGGSWDGTVTETIYPTATIGIEWRAIEYETEQPIETINPTPALSGIEWEVA